MTLINWNDSLSVYNSEIDEQHKVLIDALNSIYQVVESSSKDPQVLEKVINTLIDYTHFHFETEESKMEQFVFQELAIHKRQHEFFKKKILEIKEKFDNGEVYLKLELLFYLKDWLTNHIMRDDKRLGDFLSKFEI